MPCPANSPKSKRVVVPEFPQSKGSEGFENVPPFTITSFPSFQILMPHASKHFRVDCTSTPVDEFESLDSPFAKAANMSERWEIDLSPGKVSSPLMTIFL
jgi:hypothetical protein